MANTDPIPNGPPPLLQPRIVHTDPPKFYKKLADYCFSLSSEYPRLRDERKEKLNEIGAFMVANIKAGKSTPLVFLCNKNHCTSQLAQLWMQVATVFYSIKNFKPFSAGLQASKITPATIKVIEKVGFIVTATGDFSNPTYVVTYGNDYPEHLLYSKDLSDKQNPPDNFCAIILDNNLDNELPTVQGAIKRFVLPYEDVSKVEGTIFEGEKFDMACREIAREMFYVINYVSLNQ